MKKNSKMSKVMLAGLTLTLAGAFSVQSVFAMPDPGIGNELEMQFNVQDIVYSNIAKLSWTDGTQALKSFNSKRGIAQSISYKLGAGSDFTDYPDLTAQKVDVLLKLTGVEPSKIQSVTDGTQTLQPFVLNGTTYYLLKDGVEVSGSMNDVTGSLSITFNSVSGNTPYSAKIVTVRDQLLQAPHLEITHYGINEITISGADITDDWWSNITGISVSKDNGTTFTDVMVPELISNITNHTFTFSGNAIQFAQGVYQILYKFKSNGYEDAQVLNAPN